MVRLVATDGRRELRHLVADWLTAGTPHVVAGLELVADQAEAAPVLWASEPWLELSLAGGAYQTVGTDRATAVALGAFAAGQRKAAALRVTVPAGSPRRHLVELALGLGV